MDQELRFEKEIKPRIEWLSNERKYVEAFFFLGAVLEQELTKLIELYEEHNARLAGNNGCKLNLRAYRGSKNMTLGKLKDYLVIFVGQGNLAKELDYFIKLRNDCTHRILDKDIAILDVEISKSLNRFYKLLLWLTRRQNELLKSAIRSYKRKIKVLK